MKKRLLTVLTMLVLVAAMLLTAACGDGSMFEKNDERDMTQVTADVSYAGRNSQVTKMELSSTINNWVYQYYSYYQQGYISQTNYQAILENLPTSFKQANEDLAKTEAYVLKCMDELYQALPDKTAADQKSTVNKAYDRTARIAEIETLLPEKYLAAARKAYNDDMQEAFDGYREAYETELKNGARNAKSVENVEELIVDTDKVKKEYEKGESSLNLNGLKVSVKYKDVEAPVDLIRSDYTVTGFDSSEVGTKEITVTFGTTTSTFDVEIIAAKPSRPAMPKDEEEDEDTDPAERFEVSLEADIAAARTEDPEEYKILKEAKRRLEKSFEANYRSYDYYYLSRLKTEVTNAVEEKQTEGLEASGEEIATKYAEMAAEQREKLISDPDSYETTAESSSDYKTQIVHTDEGFFYVQHVLFKVTDELKAKHTEWKDEKIASDEALEAYLNALIDQTPVYISNIEYDKDATCEDEDCQCTACTNYKGTEPGACEDEDCECVKCPNKRFVNEDFIANVGNYVSDPDFALNADKVNEDGTINVHEVIRAMYADLGSVTADADDEARQAILKKFEKWVYMCNDDEGFFTTLSDGKVGYTIGKNHSDMVENFTNLSRALAYGTDAENWTIIGSGIGAYGYCYTEYGIHVIMLAGYATGTEAAAESGDYYVSDLDTIVKLDEYEAGEEGEVAKGTLAYYIGQSILEEEESAAKGGFKKGFYQGELTDEETTKITYYDDRYEDLIEAYGL